jgi:trimeric autotransporter adhesin
MKKILLFFLLMNLTILISDSNAQLTGSKLIPGDYLSIAAAISDLNANGVGSGGVTFNVVAGHIEIASNLVIEIAINQPTASNPVVFQRNGIGLNPLITAAPGISPSLDGIIKLSGADYITFDGIDLLDPPTNTGDEMMEWGYALLRASTTDGCQNVTIKNCMITLQKINTISNGVYIINRDLSGVVITATDPSGQNNFNRIFGNTITNVYRGIYLFSTSTARDEGNEIGIIGESPNNISNFGGSTVTAEGIRCEGQTFLKVNNNIINGGSGTTGTVYGMLLTLFGTSANATNYEVRNNMVTIQGNSNTNLSHAIRCLAGGDTVLILNNIVEDCNMINTSATFTGISHGGTSNIVFMENNIVRNNSHTSSGTSDLLVSTSTVTNLFIRSNEVYNNTKSGTGTATLIGGTGTVTNASIRLNEAYGNQITGSSGTINGIQVGNASIECDSNFVYNNSIPNSSGATACIVYGYINSASPPSEKIYNNFFYNLSVSGSNTSASSITAGIRSNAAAVTVKEIYDNTIHGLSSVSGTSTTGGVTGIWSTAGTDVKIFRNKIDDLTNNGTNGTTAGIWITTGTAFEIFNNFVSNLKAPNSTNANAVMGFSSTGTPTANSTVGFFYNSVYLNASGGTTFGSSGISAVAHATSTTGNLDLKDNIIINLSTPGSTSGFTVAYRRSIANLSNFNTASDHNDYYAGTPSSTRLIFYDGTNSDQTLADYKTRVAPADANSISKDVNFVNPSIGDLHLTGASMGDMDLAGIPIAGITTDIDGEPRNEVVPYMGADESFPPLPVELTSFTASIDRRDVHLNWTTASEMNNSGFIVERTLVRSENTPAEWINTGFVEGNGTTNETQNYSFTDRGLNSGKYNYRLKQIDYNGNFEYFNLSGEVVIGVPDKFDLSQNYPNPFNPTTKINFDLPFDSKVMMKIFDITGREIITLVNEVHEAGYYTVTFDSKGIASGVYFYRIIAEGNSQQFVKTKRMILVR